MKQPPHTIQGREEVVSNIQNVTRFVSGYPSLRDSSPEIPFLRDLFLENSRFHDTYHTSETPSGRHPTGCQ